MKKQKESCGPMPGPLPPVGPEALPPPAVTEPPPAVTEPPPAVTEGPDYKFGLILERLDDLAETLEGMGMPRLAAEADLISNSLDFVTKSK